MEELKKILLNRENQLVIKINESEHRKEDIEDEIEKLKSELEKERDFLTVNVNVLKELNTIRGIVDELEEWRSWKANTTLRFRQKSDGVCK
jgi:hypothetical protein